MDIFRILSRSTTHSKGSQTEEQRQRQQASDLKALSTQPSLKSRKRKGKSKTSGTNVSEDILNVPSEIDFFGDAQKAQHQDKQVINGRSSKRRKTDDLDSGDEISSDDEKDLNGNFGKGVPVLTTLEEADIKSLLRKHKLKYTLLSGSVQPPAPVLEDKKARKERKAKEKEAKRRLEEKEAKSKKNASTEGILEPKIASSSQSTKPDHIFPAPLRSFSELRSQFNISKRLYDNIMAQHFVEPTEVQMGSLPLLLKAKDALASWNGLVEEVDLMTVAPTGSGKTLAYSVPLVDHLIRTRKRLRDEDGDEAVEKSKGIRAIILAPTRELADQIANEIRKLVLGTGVTVIGMKKSMMPKPKIAKKAPAEVKDLLDEDSESEDEEEVEEDGDGSKRPKNTAVKTDIIVATPLLLLHALDAYPDLFDVKSVDRFILDEADVLLDELFLQQTLPIAKHLTSPNLHFSFWSATMSSTSETLATSLIQSTNTPRTIVRLISGIKDTSLPTISQRITYTATERGKLLALRQLFTSSLQTPCLIFVQTIPRAQALHAEILYDLPTPGRIAVLHSALSERARSKVMDAFRAGEVWVLITTDLLSRGVDFRGVQLVINYDIPTTVASYIHRVGRTGRANRTGGKALTLFTEEDVPYVRGIVGVMEKSGGAQGLQEWMLKSLPKTKKEDKKRLKKYGIEERQTRKEGGKNSRISTKSGYERQVEERRKGAVEGSKRRLAEQRDEANDDAGEEDDWSGFSD